MQLMYHCHRPLPLLDGGNYQVQSYRIQYLVTLCQLRPIAKRCHFLDVVSKTNIKPNLSFFEEDCKYSENNKLK
jgi:hypothetical protein